MQYCIESKELSAFCREALIKLNMSSDDATVMSRHLVQADMWGIFTHGSKNLYGYMQKAQAGGVSFTNQLTVEKDLPSAVVINANNTMGYVSGNYGMEKAVEKARTGGIGLALVRNSCHFGAVGCYSNIAAENSMIGFAATNVDKKMGIPGARGMVMGHNPFSFAAPANIIPSVILDTSSSNVASLKVLKAKMLGQSIPDTWITDAEGIPTTDPSKFPQEGALQPMGSHKGYGIAMFIEMMTSILLAEPVSTGDDIHSWCFDLDKPNNVCHMFVAINPGLLSDSGFEQRVDSFITDLRNAPKAKGTDRITVPGERMWENYNRSIAEGILLPEDVVSELSKISSDFGISINWKN